MDRHPLRRLFLAIALIAGLTGAWLFTGAAQADRADPGIAIEGWFARNKPRSPEVNTCPPAPLPPPPGGCGPINLGEVPAPQSADKGAYVVASAGGDAGRSDSSGDIGWAAFQWDVLSYLGAAVTDFKVTFTQAPDNIGDTAGPWLIQACNIVGPWGAAPGSNPWPDRPTLDDTTCVEPVVAGNKFTFDFSQFARTWVDGTGYGVAIVPGTPTKRTALTAFQVTLSGYATNAANRAEVIPKVTFEFTPIAETDFGGGGGFDDAGGFGGFDDSAGFSPNPSLDVFPNDVGSDPLDVGSVGSAPVGAGGATADRAVSASSHDPGFPLAGWLLLPVGLLLFWSTGTALGPAGDPVLPRRGGLSRLLARRRADPTTAVPQGE